MTPRDVVATNYSAAADAFDAVDFRSYYGQRTVDRAGLTAGDVVLDVCSGTGASALPAARVAQRVIGLDLAPGMVQRATDNAAAEGLSNIEFRVADFDQAYFRPGTFDAVVCVFGVFFMPDMAGAVRKMWKLLRPGGRLAITVWRLDLLQPMADVFWSAVREIRPDLYKETHAWHRLASTDLLQALFDEAGVPDVAIEVEERRKPMRGVEDWWAVVMGSGFRGVVEQMTDEERERLRSACRDALSDSIAISAFLALAVKE